MGGETGAGGVAEAGVAAGGVSDVGGETGMSGEAGAGEAGVSGVGGAAGGPALTDEEAMAVALDEARAAAGAGEVPIGAVVVQGRRVIARARNRRETDVDPTAHAEMLALREAAAALGRWRLSDATVYVTLEPCPMCAGALVAARVGRLVFGAADPKAGACGSLYNLCVDPRLNHELAVTSGVLAEPAGELLSAFFEHRRRAE